MTFSDTDVMFMRRALQLAANGRGHVSPNPMVGAVIVDASGRIIGEGWHRRFGGPHAEVNAVRSVAEADRHLLPEATIYVTLEPCSHYGKTPPCAKLLIECGIGRVVIASGDPNPRVSGRGVAMLREAGIEVCEGLLDAEACELNRAFMTAHTLGRPFVTLKWARSADGYMDIRRAPGEPAARFSTALSSQMVHRRRSVHDAIAIGAGTALADGPRLDVRLIAGHSPVPVLFDRHSLLNAANCSLLRDESRSALHITGDKPLSEVLRRLYAECGITSLLVEGGPSLLKSFIEAGLWDEAYVETAPFSLADAGCAISPIIPQCPAEAIAAGPNVIYVFRNGSGQAK
ncbi:MAG: bifunctional diaminohydroxyphosphoribosylaminopyrimidine deaminase/5-amino-6-(5-phosphoribosylamino)uracil reductase RibD [Muribaculaceae bacterium]|nr:bifunctional diaminohydroxyphosphoribosylaminopyrimidine deaminase/5-amino-6-(5-phosphoribosylamino)uracil reductase RibD [Muribaculaceae bacterium]